MHIIMGIPSYFSYIIKNYSNIIRNCKQIANESIRFQYLYMDCNSIIYDEFRKLEEKIAKDTISFEELEKILIQNVISKISLYIEFVKPEKLVYIAFDGVAPFAKMDQQRNRRHKNGMLKKFQQCSVEKLNTSGWSTSNITPGTNFMNELSNKVSKAFMHLENHYDVKDIIVSGSNEPGEGEHKMFQHIRKHKKDINGNALIYGLDSDLIMLSLFHCKYFQKMYIFRETPEFGKQYIEQSPDSVYLYIDILNFSNAILTEMNCEVYDHHRLYDYIFMCFFLGNDFLPHFPSLNIRTNGIDVLLDLYRSQLGKHKQRTFISPTLDIHWKWVSAFVTELAKDERNRIIHEYDIKQKFSKRNWVVNNDNDRDFLLQSVPVIYRPEESYISPHHSYWESRYYKSLFPKNVNNHNICINYIEGLEWVFRYYTDDCPDWRWTYNYHYPPLMKDLCKYIPKKDQMLITDTNKKPFSPFVQLAYVLPKNNHDLLPEHVRFVLESTSYYSDDFIYQWAFCRYFWEAHALLQEIPLNVLEKWDSEWKQ